MLESLHQLIESHDFSEDKNHFVYTLGFSSEHSFRDLLFDSYKWSFLRECKVHIRYSDPDNKLSRSQSLYITNTSDIRYIANKFAEEPTIHDELNLAEITKKSEELFELTAHLSPEMYGCIHEKVYASLDCSNLARVDRTYCRRPKGWG
jgi:hypothetical protein